MISSNIALARNSLAQAGFEPPDFASALRAALIKRAAALTGALKGVDAQRSGEWLGLLVSALAALDDAARLSVLADQLAARMAAARVPPSQYGAIGQALMDTLALQLGPAFTGDVREAWTEAYVQIAEAVMAARYNRFDLAA